MATPPNGIPCQYCGKKLCNGTLVGDPMPPQCPHCGHVYYTVKKKHTKSKTPAKQVIYIGDQFYRQSGSAMSSVYEVRTVNGKKEYKRYDYGFLQCDLANGIRVNMRPATSKELGMFVKALFKVKEDMDAIRTGA